MFIHRLITTLTLIPLALLMIYFSWPWLLALAVLMIVCIGGWEWTRLIPIETLLFRFVFILLLVGLTLVCKHFIAYWSIVSLFFWLLVLLAVIQYPSSASWWGKPMVVAGLAIVFFPLLGSGLATIYSMPQGKDLIVYLFCLVWAADVGAYVAGKLWGRHKLIPRVSPGKTIEGFLGGFFVVLLVSLVAQVYFQPDNLWMWYIMACLIALISVLGDLFFSMLKRRCHLKDSGQLFPGHGGALDRFDSLLAAIPVFMVGINLMLIGV